MGAGGFEPPANKLPLARIYVKDLEPIAFDFETDIASKLPGYASAEKIRRSCATPPF